MIRQPEGFEPVAPVSVVLCFHSLCLEQCIGAIILMNAEINSVRFLESWFSRTVTGPHFQFELPLPVLDLPSRFAHIQVLSNTRFKAAIVMHAVIFRAL